MSERKSLLQEDQDLIDDIAQGRPEALETVYQDHFPIILNYILKNSGNEEDAKDTFQEAVIVLYDKIIEGEFQLTSRLQTYLYSVCRFIWLKKLSSSGQIEVSLSHELGDNIAYKDDIEDSEKKEVQFFLMDEALSLLGEPCKTIIKDFYIYELSMQDIAEKFGYTNANNAKNQKYKCLQRLKKLYFNYENKSE